MKKRYFAKKSRWDPKLFLIMGIIAGVFVLALSVPYLWSHGRTAVKSTEFVSDLNAVEALEKAYALVAEGAIEEAEQHIKPLLTGTDPVVTPRAIILQADIEHHRGAADAALQLLSDAVEKFRSSREYPYLEERKARQLEEMTRLDEARVIYEALRDNAPPEIRSMGYLGLGRLEERGNELVAARDLYRRAVEDAPWASPVWEEAAELMGRVNIALIFSPMETPESRYHTVEKGENLISIGMKLNTTQGLLTIANNIDETTTLRLGQRLKYTPKDFFIIIERSTCNLYLFDNRGLFKKYRTGLGKPGHETTLGKYTIGNKQQDPIWHKPGAGPIPAGDPENELGTRWMPLVPVEEGLPKDLGIHGTIAPETIGTFASKGCARMLNSDVEELYDLVVRATPVEIVETIQDHVNDPALADETAADTAAAVPEKPQQ
jgi:lipoprotein-anchoring transpeptidase ErfK/SrfK